MLGLRLLLCEWLVCDDDPLNLAIDSCSMIYGSCFGTW